MGFLTTITLHNDAVHVFEEHPEEFAKALFKGMDEANREHKSADVGFHGYCNYITVEPSRHADAVTVYLHWGNMVSNINAYEPEFDELCKTQPELAKKMIKIAKDHLKFAERRLKELTEKKNG